jgi:hypothetical protein
MQAAVAVLEEAGKEANESLDEIERKILFANPSAKPLLDLCARLRAAKSRLLAVKTTITQLFTAQDQLKQNLAQYLMPAAESIKGACLARSRPAPRIVFAASPTEQPSTDTLPIESLKVAPPPPVLPPVAEKKAPTPPVPKHNRHTSPRVAKPHPPLPPAPPPPAAEEPFVDITEDEFRRLDTRAFGNIPLAEVRDVYRMIWNFYKDQDDKSVVLTRKAMGELGAKMSCLLRVLKFLKSLRRITLTKDDNVRWVSQ